MEHWLFGYLKDFLHSFRMYAFYVVAGFFFMLVQEKYDKKKVLRDRLLRLGVPLVFVGLCINPLMGYFSINRQVSDQWWLYLARGEWLAHLWFIGNLIVYCCIGFLLAGSWQKCNDFIERMRIHRFWVLIVTPAFAVLLARLAADFPKALIFVYPRDLFYFFPYFILGCFLKLNAPLFRTAMRLKFVVGWLLIALGGHYFLSKLDLSGGSGFFERLSQEHVSASTAFLALSLFDRFTRDTKVVRDLSASSYTIYLLHQPLLVLLYVPVLTLKLDMFGEYAILCLVVFALSYGIHKLLVEKNKVFRFLLNGVELSKPVK